MSQLALFDLSVRLLDSERGKVTYQAGFVSAGEAARWFAILHDTIEWRATRRMMYEREVDVPRVTAHFLLDTAGRVDGSAPEAVADVLRVAAERVCAAIGAPFNSIGVNLYRDGVPVAKRVAGETILLETMDLATEQAARSKLLHGPERGYVESVDDGVDETEDAQASP